MDIGLFQSSEGLATALPLSKALRRRILFHEPLRVAMQYIVSHANSPIRLKVVATAVNMERTSFCRYFRRKTGMGFCDFVHVVKITMAEQLLAESDRSVALLAVELGFGSVSAFVRNFKRATGFTPTAFRQHILAGYDSANGLVRTPGQHHDFSRV
jgi:AraC-like DNA-binding protein